uniref:Vasotocin-neurophysin VT 2 n=1 Tax=Catostomus commersonii TaxID=7971 RepID=NEU4_CATCO|nr:RecName: Full=Vasotocin-neurophysin VT 2; Contains: RecName: Full=Vasotocin; Short=VT; Contains: RecName: Full=Neurophysin VT 2; Flags: Precursor [Catostomus commersonii]AAA49199.1 vasotocin-2 precursor [Catostomus commersonii]
MSVCAVLLLCVAGLLCLSSACYIQNCPRGGKRALLEPVSRQCLACGPGDKGRCLGPSICCGEEIGCLVGSPWMARCQEEEYLPSPCQTAGKLCGSDAGPCAAPGVCCGTEGCKLDPNCSEDSESEEPADQNTLGASPGELLLRLLHPNNRKHNQY